MKMKTSELTDQALDWAVAKAAEGGGYPIYWRFYTDGKPDAPHWGESGSSERFRPSLRGDHAVSIIEREKLSPQWDKLWNQWSIPHPKNAALSIMGETFLVAGLRCFVVSRLGDEVEIPDQLVSAHMRKSARHEAGEAPADVETSPREKPRGG